MHGTSRRDTSYQKEAHVRKNGDAKKGKNWGSIIYGKDKTAFKLKRY